MPDQDGPAPSPAAPPVSPTAPPTGPPTGTATAVPPAGAGARPDVTDLLGADRADAGVVAPDTEIVGHVRVAQVAAVQAQEASAPASGPQWMYAVVIASLTGNRTVDTAVMSATTLIAGGLIGVLAPSPRRP